MGGEGEGGQAVGGDVDAEFLAQFPDEGGFGGFAGVEFAAGEFPQAGHFFALGATSEENAAVAVDQGAGGDEDERLGARGDCGGVGVDRDAFAGGFEDEDFEVPVAGDEVLGFLAGVFHADFAEHGDRAGIAGGDGCGDAIDIEICERPTAQAAGGFGGDAMAPEAAADPVAEAGAAGFRVETQADGADQDFGVVFAPGDGEMVFAAFGEGFGAEVEPGVGFGLGVGVGNVDQG